MAPSQRGLRLLTLLLVVLWVRCEQSAYAQHAITVTQNRYQVQFARSITFDLQIEAGTSVCEVTLYYRRAGKIVTVKIPFQVTAGQTAFHHTWQLEPGDIPVGAQLQYEWRIVDTVGNTLQTSTLSFTYDDDRFTWKTLSNEQIVLHWYGSDEEQAKRLQGYANEALAHIQDDMGLTPNQVVNIYVYQSKSDMSEALPQRSSAFDDRILTLGVMVDDATLLILGPHSDVQGTIAHELTHIVVGLATQNPYADLPRWLDEGLAMNAEGKLPSNNASALQDAVHADSLISVRSLSGYAGDPSEVDLFYGEVYSLVDFMLKTYGKDKLSELLSAFREGWYQEQALQRVYGFGVEELDLQWRKSLGLVARPTPAPGTTAVPRASTPRSDQPCAASWLGGLLGLTALLTYGRRRAGAA